jgi:hypothetical protein
MPTVKRALGDLGVDIEMQSALHFEAGVAPWLRYCPVDIPREVHVLSRLSGGYEDYVRSLRGLGMAQHALHTDSSVPFWQRCSGDDTPTRAYGALLEGLTRDKTWLTAQLGYLASDDYRVISTLRSLHRVRHAAANALYEQQLWQAEPGGALAADYEVRMSEALRAHHFADEFLMPLLDAPWSMLSSAVQLRAEVFAAQLRAFLVREFDEEWWRSSRAARFIVQELWRVGRRHTAEELLGYMGYEGFDPGILWAEMAEVLAPL